jgi:TetR/AcrR family transcriptional repressor of lmrAB and yxaGH operons
MPPALLTREEVIDRLLGVFRRSSFQGASLSELSKATGLGKSSLYHHFPGGKEEMVGVLLDYVDGWLAEHVRAAADASGPPAERLRRIVKALETFYEGGKNPCLMGNLVLGGGLPMFQARLRKSFRVLLDGLADVAADGGVGKAAARQRAEDAVIRLQGALVLSAAMGDNGSFSRVMKRLPQELLQTD